MQRIDEINTECPFCRSRGIGEDLGRKGFGGQKRALSFMRLMGLRAIYPKENFSKRYPRYKYISTS